MYNVEIKNCNNITMGHFKIYPEKLNIKYGINGTGKTTISKAIDYFSDNDKLQTLKSFYSEDSASITIEPAFNNVLIFDETFVNQVVFKENEVIGKPFEVFIKTPTYDSRKAKLDEHLAILRKLMEEDNEVVELRDKLSKLLGKFTTTTSGKLSKKGALGSLLSKNNLYNIPIQLENYRSFISDSDNNINWIAWKTQGDKFDTIDKCPFCAESLPQTHEVQKKVFSQTYKKSDSQNLKEVMDLLESLEVYLDPIQFSTLISYIKQDTPEDTIQLVINKLYTEFDLLLKKFNAMINFGKKQIAIADISTLDTQINNMEIPADLLMYYGGDLITDIVGRINENVESLKSEVGKIKEEMGSLKGVMQATIKESQDDINRFLKTAGINYELEIQAEDETNSKTILKQCFSDEKTDVSNIRSHLSWGEKNAFSLILFMYYAKSLNPDLIILDDPISSFDSNKKFAILHRLFKKDIGKKDVSFAGKTVLLLTHDFEPIIDFVIIGKLSGDSVTSSFIWNAGGKVDEEEVDSISDVKLVLTENKEIASTSDINIVSRIAALRKCCELNGCVGVWGYAYEILSCLIHGNEIKRKIANEQFEDMPPQEVESGIQLIKEYISDFVYETLKEHTYTQQGLKELYQQEQNSYFKLQLFRAMCEICNKIKMCPQDNAWYKFIDETYHIENDYLHYLDVRKFNIVPTYIASKVDEMMAPL